MGKEQKKKQEPKEPIPMNEYSVGSPDDRIISVYRGKIIHYVANLEYLAEEIILEYYFPDHSEERKKTFIYSILTQEKFGMMSKFVVIAYIVKNHFTDFENIHSNFLDLFEKLIVQRNNYAHHKPYAPKYGTQEFLLLTQAKIKKSKPDLHTSLLNETTLEIFYGRYFEVKTGLHLLLQRIQERNKKR